MDEITKAESRGYAKGYAAGKRRREKERSARGEAARRSARFDRFLCAAITGLLGGNGPWQRDGIADKSPADYANTAACIARELMRKTQ